MAVASRFEFTSSHPTSLTVVGGGNLKPKYGSYRFNLGPGAGGEYHEISCLGMDSICTSATQICGGFRSTPAARNKKY